MCADGTSSCLVQTLWFIFHFSQPPPCIVPHKKLWLINNSCVSVAMWCESSPCCWRRSFLQWVKPWNATSASCAPLPEVTKRRLFLCACVCKFHKHSRSLEWFQQAERFLQLFQEMTESHYAAVFSALIYAEQTFVRRTKVELTVVCCANNLAITQGMFS